MKPIIWIYEVDSDRGIYWECDPDVPDIWDGGVIEEDPWPTIRAISEAGYQTIIQSQAWDQQRAAVS